LKKNEREEVRVT